MVSESGRTGRPGRPTGRGRPDTPSARTASRPAQRSAQTRPQLGPDSAAEQGAAQPTGVVPRLRNSLRITQRAIVVVVVLVILLVSYATTLRVYLNQQYQLAELRQQIAAHEESISRLGDEIERWEDPEYVKIQARERLGWVVPGEIGFRVLGPDGKPYGGGSQIGAAKLPEGEYARTWWDRMWSSVAAADDPAPIEDASISEPVRPDEPEPTTGP